MSAHPENMAVPPVEERPFSSGYWCIGLAKHFFCRAPYAQADNSLVWVPEGDLPFYLRNATISARAKIEPLKPGKVAQGVVSVVDKEDYTACLEICGNVFEFSAFAKPVRTGGAKAEATETGKESEQKAAPEELTEQQQKDAEERSRKESARRKRSKIAKLTNINFHNAPAFLTLTFGNAIEPREAIRQLSKFLRRLGAKHKDMRYLWILELQKSGRPHFHLLIEGLPPEVFEKMWYVKTKKRAKVFQLMQDNGQFGREFGRVRFFETKRAAKDYAKAHGRDVAYSSSLVKDWRQGFVHIRELKDKNGDMLSDVGAYITKYMTKDDTQLEGVTSYSFSRGKLRQRGFRLLNDAGSKMFAWFQQNIQEFIKHIRQYEGENIFLGQWKKVYLSVDRAFVNEFLPDVEEWFSNARDVWGQAALWYQRQGESSQFQDIGVTEYVRMGLI